MPGIAPHRVTVDLQQAEMAHGTPMMEPDGAVKHQPISGPAPDPSEAIETYDLVIIGAGPAGLATLARALESRPGALYTDEERRHLHWLQRSSRPRSSLLHFQRDQFGEPQAVRRSNDSEEDTMAQKSMETPGCTHIPRSCPCPRVLVIDKSGKGWAGQYHSLLDAYEIKFLRSPMFFHPSPGDHDDLLAYAARVGLDITANPAHVPIGQGGHAPISVSSVTKPLPTPLPHSLSAAERRRMRKGTRLVPGIQDGHDGHHLHLLEIPGIVGTGLTKHRRKKLAKKVSGGRAPIAHDFPDDQSDITDSDLELPEERRSNEEAMKKRSLGVNVNERAREDFFAPSTPLFFRFCDEDIVERLGIPSGFPNQGRPRIEVHPEPGEKLRSAPKTGKSSRRMHHKVPKPTAAPVPAQEPKKPQREKVQEAKQWPTYDEVLRRKQGSAIHTNNGTVVTLAKGSVEDVAWYEDGGCDCSPFNPDGVEGGAFALRLNSGQVIAASAIVSAVGPGGMPQIPPALMNGAIKSSEDAPSVQVEQEEETAAQLTSNAEQEETASAAAPVNESTEPGMSSKPQSGSKSEESSKPEMNASDPWDNPRMGPGWCHSLSFIDPNCQLPPAHVKERMADPLRRNPTTLLVIGGGLTSSQIVDLCLRHDYFDCVHLIMRGPLKCKQIDVGHEWLGKYANLNKMRFWQENSAEMRWQMIKEARNGGAITPTYVKVLAFWQQTGRLQVHQFTTLESFEWDEAQSKANVSLLSNKPMKYAAEATSPKGTKGGRRRSSAAEETMEQAEMKDMNGCATTRNDLTVDYIISATGQVSSFASLPFTKRLLHGHPIPVIHGLPLLNEDLQWSPSIPFFAVGAYAALQVGPGSWNLIGIREGADRVAVRLVEMAASSHKGEKTAVESGEAQSTAAPAESNKTSGPPSRFTHFGFEVLGEA